MFSIVVPGLGSTARPGEILKESAEIGAVSEVLCTPCSAARRSVSSGVVGALIAVVVDQAVPHEELVQNLAV